MVFAVVNYLQRPRVLHQVDLLALAWRVAAVVVLSSATILDFCMGIDERVKKNETII